MKRILLLSKSQLERNLLDLILPFIRKKAELLFFADIDELNRTRFAKPIQVLVIDTNVIDAAGFDALKASLAGKSLKDSRRLLIRCKDSPVSEAVSTALGMHDTLTKPFLVEEMAALLDKALGRFP